MRTLKSPLVLAHSLEYLDGAKSRFRTYKRIMKRILLAIPLIALLATSAFAQQSLDAMIDREIAQLVTTYKMLHASPELSHYEVKTSAFLADQLRSFGYTA